MYKRVDTREEFFSYNSEKCTEEFLAEQVYIMVHTCYLKEGKIKPAMGRLWKELFGKYMEHSAFEYLLTLEPVMLRDIVIEETKKGKEINSIKFIAKTVTAFEFDLWLVERHRVKKELNINDFEKYIYKKYGNYLKHQWRHFKEEDLYGIEDLENIAVALDEYYSDIVDIFDKLVKNNKMKIDIDDHKVTRIDETEEKIDNISENIDSEAPEEINGNISEQETVGEGMESSRPDSGSADTNVAFTESNEIYIRELEERIEHLEQDIKEFKRQRDETREYSINQYDRGIKDLFTAVNDVRYGKIIDYLYSTMQAPDTDENLASYLENLFMALEDMEIEPAVEENDLVIKEESLHKQYNLEFDRSKYAPGKVRLKYTGWKYKDVIIEKPTLEIKEG